MPTLFINRLIVFSTITLLFISCQKKVREAVELTEEEKRLPENALVGFEIADGLEATLFAYEPMIVNPTNMDIDSKGRIWICEGYNYRPHLNPGNPTKAEGDRIVILEDTDQDGKADSRKVFYQSNDVNAALGITVLGSKIIVSVSPNVLVFTDEDGDDKPEKKEILFSNIGGEQHDHAVHAFVFGPDGKLYFNMGNAGGQLADKEGEIIRDVTGKEIVDNGKPYREGMIFRTDFEGSTVEVLGHNFRNPYEVTLDSYGNMWQSDNDDDGNKGVRINFIVPYGNYGYRDEMTGANWRVSRSGMHEEIPLRHWHQNDPGVIPNLLQTGAGSPTGIVFYEGDLLPKPFQNAIIHTDAGPNVVRAYPTQKSGAGYTAEIKNIMKAKSDQWFRPADVCVAPDGSIFVADWYDPGVGGHQVGDQQQGRVYRIAPKDTPYRVTPPILETPEDAAEAIKSPNMATRYLAWTKLKDWGKAAEQPLKTLYDGSQNHIKARALWLLAQIDGKTSEYIQMGLKEANEDLRITALKIAQSFDAANLKPYLNQLRNDPSLQVQREILTALKKLPAEEAIDLWVMMAQKYPVGDRWYLETLGLVSDQAPDEYLAAWKNSAGESWNTDTGRDIVWRSRSVSSLPLLSQLIKNTSISEKDLNRYFRAFDFIESPQKEKTLIALLDGEHPRKNHINLLVLNHVSPSSLASSSKLKGVLTSTLNQVKGTEQYIEWVRKFELTDQTPELERLYLTDPNGKLGIAAADLLLDLKGLDYFKQQLKSGDQTTVNNTIAVLSNTGGNQTWNLLKDIAFDENENLALRKKAISAMGKGWSAESKLLDMLVKNEIPEQFVEIAASTLMSAIKGSVREEAAKYLSLPEGESLPPVEELVALSGSPENGKVVFDQYCQTCHQVNGAGTQFGPNLSEIGNKLSKEGLYAAILYPDAGINFGYEGFVLETKSGDVAVGYISSQTEDEIELTMMGGIKSNYKRTDIASLKEMENSLMTSGLHRAMTAEQIIDLVTYLGQLGKEPS
ncbi:MAG: PQQ-dependent sugar dehydrogenase [Cyclobacteriaceae bacterium]